MKRRDIDKKFTEWVSLYITEGYILSPISMTGHQGEEGKVDLVKGDELIRVWLEKKSAGNWRDKSAFHGYTMYLRIGRWNYPASHIKNSFSTAWMQDFYVTHEMKFYEISSTWYVATEEEAVAIQDIRHKRYSDNIRSYQERITTQANIEVAVKYLKTHAGYSRVSRSEIDIIKRYSEDTHHAAYYVYYHGNAYFLK